MSRDWRLYLDDVVESADRVQAYTAGMTFEEFVADRRTYDAVLRNLEIIGEAVKRLPAEVRALAPTVPWSQIAGFRDRIAHAYFSLHDPVIWDVVRNRAPEPACRSGSAPLSPGPDSFLTRHFSCCASSRRSTPSS